MKIRFIAISFILLCSGATALAADTTAPSVSVFFTPDEAKQINALVGQKPDKGHSDIYLGAVMYYAPNDWTLWLQGERWTPATEHADLHVLDVKPGEVRLSVAASPDLPPREITLKPNQTYRIATDSITEGGP